MSSQGTTQAVVVSQTTFNKNQKTENFALFHSDGTPVDFSESAEVSGPVTSPAAPPASGSPWTNSLDRNAFITLAATGITAVSITGANAVTASFKVPSSATDYNFVLPKGASYTPTYTGTLTATVVLF